MDRLCQALEKTKGSFYHHFVDIGACHTAVLTAWADEHTSRPIDLASAELSVEERSARLERVVHALDHAIDRAVRAWALYDEDAQMAVQRVDQRRIAFLEKLHRDAGHGEPKLLAELEYAAFLGAQQIDAFKRRPRAAQLGQAMSRALVLLSNDVRGRDE